MVVRPRISRSGESLIELATESDRSHWISILGDLPHQWSEEFQGQSEGRTALPKENRSEPFSDPTRFAD